MVIEHFKGNNPRPIGERFSERGRMMPSEVAYIASWIDADNGRCFQVMSAPNRESLIPWVACWEDLVDFEIIPVQTSADFWAGINVR